jgi:hypothetical protein
MNKFSSGTVVFTGTCTEYVVVDGFENLTLTDVQGARPLSLCFVDALRRELKTGATFPDNGAS